MKRTANSNRKFGPKLGLAVATALAAGLLTGCATQAAPRADLSASRAEAALAKGKTQAAVDHAEAAVLAEPRNASYRAMLGSAYLDAGRFASAETTFNDAMKLGDNSTRTALSLALALDGQGKYQQAVGLLDDWQKQIAPADLGLAYALSGKPDKGVAILANAIRSGENTPKVRQNLAYAYALAGRWRDARIMASQDIPANLVGDRMEEWAEMVQPQAWQTRVADMVGAPTGVVDQGQPAQLALANNPSVEQLASEASAVADPKDELAANDKPSDAPQPQAFAAAAKELPPVASAAPDVSVASCPAPKTSQPDDFKSAFATIAPSSSSISHVTHDATRFAPQPAMQIAALRESASLSARHTFTAKESAGTHLVQLGSFSSEQGARRAWGIYTKRYPQLRDHQMVIDEAVVRGKHYWRVSAAGFGLASSQAMCGRVKNSGEGCFAYAEGHPLPGAVDTGTRLALR
jgi:Flp pilus assembly protein TadD